MAYGSMEEEFDFFDFMSDETLNEEQNSGEEVLSFDATEELLNI